MEQRGQSQAMEQRGQSQARLSYAESRQSSRNSNRLNYAERERARRSQGRGEVKGGRFRMMQGKSFAAPVGAIVEIGNGSIEPFVE